MNRIIINGVTIELQADMLVTINNNYVVIKHTEAEAVVPISTVIAPTTIASTPTQPPAVVVEKRTYTKYPTSSLLQDIPKNFDRAIIDYLRAHEGRAYKMALSMVLREHTGKIITSNISRQLDYYLIQMINKGLLVALTHEGKRLYGLASMIEPREINSHHPTPPTYSEEEENNVRQ